MKSQPRAIAATVTPLTAGGAHIDHAAIAALVDFYAASALDGLLVLGTTGEGILLSPAERRAAAREFIASAGPQLPVIVHCGAQSTRDTAMLAEQAVTDGAAGIAVIAPPYFALDDRALEEHFVVAARASAPAPFYVYEFAARSGYAVPIEVIEKLRERAPNLAGLKVSDTPFEQVKPYLLGGLDVFVGAEELIHLGLASGAAGAVSGLAAALPEVTVRALLTATAEDSAAAGRIRATLQPFPFHAALKHILRWRGVAIGPAVRAPLRPLDAAEAEALEALLSDPHGDWAQSTAVSAVSGPSKRSSRSGEMSNVLQR